MEREQLFHHVDALRREGKSVRVIATELGVPKGRVERALKRIARRTAAEAAVTVGLISSAFVGRHEELAALTTVLNRVISGGGHIVTLAGEPGIGKTRTAQELAAIARELGADVLWGRCYEVQGAPPYWPWVQVIRACAQSRPPEQLRSIMGAGAASIAQVVPELRELMPGLASQHQPDSPEASRFRLFDSVVNFLKRASEKQPLLIVLDNLHRTDRSSLMMLEFLAQEISESRVMVLGTYRDIEVPRQHPLRDTIVELTSVEEFQRLSLTGLSEEAVRQFIQESTGHVPPQELVSVLHTRSEGNPLFMIELLRLFSNEGMLSHASEHSQSGWNLGIPDSVRDVILRRLSRLSEPCNEVLTVASIIGREFGVEQLERVEDDLSPDDLLEALDEATEARVIEETEQLTGRYQFTHVLIRDTLASGLSSTRQARLHARVGQTLEMLYGDDLQSHAAELAQHFSEAKPVIGSEKLIRYSLMAGEHALASYAWEEAEGHFQRVLSEKEGQPADDAIAAARFGLGRVKAATTGRQEAYEAVAHMTEAFNYYIAVGNIQRAVEVVEYSVQPVQGVTSQTLLLAHALRLVPPGSIQEGRLLSRYGLATGVEEGRYDEAQAAFEQALWIARREKDEGLELWTLANASDVDHRHLHRQLGLERSLRAIELARRLNDVSAEALAHFTAIRIFSCTGDHQRGLYHAEAMIELAEKYGMRYMAVNALQFSQTMSISRGDWEAARGFRERVLTLSSSDPPALGQAAYMEYLQGNFDQGEAYLHRLLEIMRGSTREANTAYQYTAHVVPCIALDMGVAHDLDVAETAARTGLSSSAATPSRTHVFRLGLALIALLRNDPMAAEEQYVELEPLRGTLPFCLTTSMDRVLGLLAHAIGREGDAAAHFEDALAFCRKWSLRPELAWSCCNYAEMLLDRSTFGDGEQIMSLLDEALSISTELGMRPLMERTAALKLKANFQSGGHPEYPDGLTQREVEVLRLIASGNSNREVAEELFLSLRTIERHITNIYTKTRTRGRADATAYAIRHGLSGFS